MSAFDFQGFSENFSFARMATASAVVLAAVLGANWMLKPSSSTNGDKAAFDLATLSVPGSAAPALLAHGLETVASGQDWIAPKKRFALRPTLTVASKDGSFCRRFEVATRDGTQAAGFACRSGEKSWTVEALGSVRLATAPKSSDSVAPAGASDPLIDSAISRLAIGDVLSTEHEAEVLAHGWKKIVEGE